MAGPSRASELYHKIVGDPATSVTLLENMVTRRQAEDDYLEFKGAGKIPNHLIKEYWSQVLSGFANTEGGVLIWGIRAGRVEHPPRQVAEDRRRHRTGPCPQRYRAGPAVEGRPAGSDSGSRRRC